MAICASVRNKFRTIDFSGLFVLPLRGRMEDKMRVVFIIGAIAVFALLFFVSGILLAHCASSDKKYRELKAMLEEIKNKPPIAPVVSIQAPIRQKGPVRMPAPGPAAPAALQTARVPVKYTAGEVKLHSVPDKVAAMLMAITADELGIPISELRFISIREVQ